MLIVYTGKVQCSFLHPDIYGLKIALLQRRLLLRLANPASLFSLFNPASFFQLNAVSPPLYSTVYNKHTGLPGCCSFCIQEPRPPNPSYSMSLCLFFLHFLTAPVRSIPGARVGCSRWTAVYQVPTIVEELLVFHDYWERMGQFSSRMQSLQAVCCNGYPCNLALDG